MKNMTIDQEGITACYAGGKKKRVRCIAGNMAYCTDEVQMKTSLDTGFGNATVHTGMNQGLSYRVMERPYMRSFAIFNTLTAPTCI